ncbi:MAG: NUMOD4 domain-containing protein, partial [Phycisphaerae bacterium]
METWKPILGFESLYEVSDFGNVRRIARGKTLD